MRFETYLKLTKRKIRELFSRCFPLFWLDAVTGIVSVHGVGDFAGRVHREAGPRNGALCVAGALAAGALHHSPTFRPRVACHVFNLSVHDVYSSFQHRPMLCRGCIKLPNTYGKLTRM